MNQAIRESEIKQFTRSPERWVQTLVDHVNRRDDPLGIDYIVGYPTTEYEARSYIVEVFGHHRRTLPLVLSQFKRKLGNMPYRKTGRRVPKGTNAALRASVAARKAAKAQNYGATSSFNRALTAAVQKVEARSQETVYSQSGVYMDSSAATFTQSGYSLSGLNTSAAWTAAGTGARCNATNQAFVWPLSPMAQVGNTSNPGFRRGQRINPIGFRVSIAHEQAIPSVSATYKWALLRNVGQTLSNNNVTPGITQTNALGIFVPWTQGPLASAGGPNGVLPNGDFSSITRWSRQDWSVKKHGSWTMQPALNRENSSVVQNPQATTQFYSSSKLTQCYIAIKDTHWDYPTPTGIANIKGGDYYFVIWREGVGDPFIGRDYMACTFELSFKDP